jgi:hypothetical protein
LAQGASHNGDRMATIPGNNQRPSSWASNLPAERAAAHPASPSKTPDTFGPPRHLWPARIRCIAKSGSEACSSSTTGRRHDRRMSIFIARDVLQVFYLTNSGLLLLLLLLLHTTFATTRLTRVRCA